MFLSNNIKLVVLTILLSLTSFFVNSQTKKLIDVKLLQELLEDNFRKDTLIAIQDEIILKQESVIFGLDTLNNYKDLRISKLSGVINVISNQNQILQLNNNVLTKSTFELTTYLDRYKTDNVKLVDKVKKRNKWLKVSTIVNATFIAATILYFKLK